MFALSRLRFYMIHTYHVATSIHCGEEKKSRKKVNVKDRGIHSLPRKGPAIVNIKENDLHNIHGSQGEWQPRGVDWNVHA